MPPDQGQRHGTHAAAAAVAVASHDVLPPSTSQRPQPTSTPTWLPAWRWCPTGGKQDIGVSIGAAAADRMIASRVNDGRNDGSVVYSKAPNSGVWQPAPGGAMALPWLGFVDPVVDVPPVALDGPDPLDQRGVRRRTTTRCVDVGAGRLAGDGARGADRDRAVLLGATPS